MAAETPDRTGALRGAILFEGALGILAVGVGALSGVDPLGTFAPDAGAALVGAAGTLPMLVLLAVFVRSRSAPFVRIREIVETTLLPLVSSCSLPQLAGIALLAGLTEEMLFRGAIQGALEPEVGAVAAAVIGGVLFGLAHAVTRTYALLGAVVGVWLGWLQIATGNILAPVLTHALYDFVAFVVLVREYRRRRG